jgi:hypothetical protein
MRMCRLLHAYQIDSGDTIPIIDNPSMGYPMGFAAGDTNLYRYVGNDPVNDRDPTGLQDAGDGSLRYE